ncbi:MAG: radical SAM protein [Phycisphaerae bacterium]
MNTDRRVAFLQPSIPDGNYLPNLGIMYLAGVLLREGYDVKVFDENIDNDVTSGIVAFDPSILGITCVTAAVGPACRLAHGLKERLPGLKVVVGGPHITALPTETLDHNRVIDYGLVGEAEETFPRLCRLLLEKPLDKDAVARIPGLVHRVDGTTVSNHSAGYLSDQELNDLPYPPWHLLPMERIFTQTMHGLFTRGRRIMPVMTTRGCPNYCTFCSRVMGFQFRRRSIENVIGEIQWLYDQYQVDEIYFEDDTFTQDPVRAHQLLDAIIDLNLGIYIKFANGLRADKVDRALLEKMKASGVYWVGFGIESGSPHTQELMMKKLDLALAAENVRLAKSMGFKVGSNCIIGYPGETKQDIAESLNFFLKLPLDSFAVVPCIPFPGTTAWMQCDKNGWLTERAGNYDNYWFEVFKVNPLIETPHLTADDLAGGIREAYIRFYFFNPRRAMLIGKMILKRSLNRLSDIRWLRMLRANSASMPRPASADYAC